jgi:hypothetical protein
MMLDLLLKGASLLGKLGGGGAKASADARNDAAYQDAQLAAINNRNQIDTAGHNLNASQFNLQAPSMLAKRGVGAAGLMNYATKGSHPAAQGFSKSLQDPSVRDAILSRLVGQSGQQLGSGSYRAPMLSPAAPVQRNSSRRLAASQGCSAVSLGV